MILFNYNYRGMGLVSVLVTMSLFSFIFMAVNQWERHQRKRAVEIYQVFQAIQIAENQRQRQFLSLPCETQLIFNQVKFTVQCRATQVTVEYPSGKITL